MRGNSFAHGPGAGQSMANGPANPSQVNVYTGERPVPNAWWRLV